MFVTSPCSCCLINIYELGSIGGEERKKKKIKKKNLAPDLKVNVAKLTMDVVKANLPRGETPLE